MPALVKVAALAALCIIALAARPAAIEEAPAAEPIMALVQQCAPRQPWPAISANAAPNSTYEAVDKPIPARFQAPVNGVRVDFASAAEVDRVCAGGKPVCGRRFYACAFKAKLLLLPNPCDVPGAPRGEGYAGLLCHELAHLNGWPATHGD
jgi:hypothetical protein